MEGGDENKVEREGVGIFNSERLSRLLLLKSNLAGPAGPTDLSPPVISLLIPPLLLLFISKLKGVALLLLLMLWDSRAD